MNHSSYHLFSTDIGPKVLMNPDDAAAIGAKNGIQVKLENSLGSISLPVEISDRVAKGVVVSYIGFWPKLSGGRNINFLTTDYIQKFGGNSAYHSTFVSIAID